ncbi:MAG: FGGY-family carbohydrate kinase [Spirochaetota bacterium]
MYILSADFGTSSLKLCIVDEKLRVVCSGKQEYKYQVKDGAKVEIDPEVVFKSFLQGVKCFEDYLPDVEALAICNLCPSLIPMDDQGKPLYPAIIHLDRRSEAQAKYALDIIGKRRFMQINGNLPFPGGISLTSMLWLKEKLPEVFNSAWKMGHLNTYLHRAFTGKFAIDPTNASYTGLYRTLDRGGWSDELCGELGIPTSKLPDITASAQVVGELGWKPASMTGLRQGIPVVMGANDTSSAALGAGVTHDGAILNISGSNEIITISTSRPLPHPKVYLRAHAVEGRWLVLAITIGGGALEWFRREFYRDMENSYFYQQYLPEFIEKDFRVPGVRFYPHLAGDRHSIAQKKAKFTGITLENSREDFLSALLVGIFEPIRMVMDIYEKRVDLTNEIVLTGGMVSRSYLDFKKKMFKNYTFKRTQNCNALGNARLARLALNMEID